MMAHTQVIPPRSQTPGLAEVLERVLDKGIVIAGDIKIKLCDVELLSIQIRLLIASVDKAKEMGLTWWWQVPAETLPPVALPPPPARQTLRVDAAAPNPWEHSLQFRHMKTCSNR